VARITAPFRVPASCPECGQGGNIAATTSLRGNFVVLTWCCRACSHEWPIAPGDQLPERRIAADRRRARKTDRRL
jgi:hypothetical protein